MKSLYRFILILPLLAACGTEMDSPQMQLLPGSTTGTSSRLALTAGNDLIDLDCTANLAIPAGATENQIKDLVERHCKVSSRSISSGSSRGVRYKTNIYYYMPNYWDTYYAGYRGNYNNSCTLLFGNRARNWGFDCISGIGGYSPSTCGQNYNNYCTTYCVGSFNYNCSQACGQQYAFSW